MVPDGKCNLKSIKKSLCCQLFLKSLQHLHRNLSSPANLQADLHKWLHSLASLLLQVAADHHCRVKVGNLEKLVIVMVHHADACSVIGLGVVSSIKGVVVSLLYW